MASTKPVDGFMTGPAGTGWLDREKTAWVAGVALPIAMVILDPAVFRSQVFGLVPIYGAVKPFGYVAIACGVAVVVRHLLSTRPSAFVAGCLAAGSVFAFALGLALLPLTFMGTIFFGVGLLGLTPFLSAVVVGRRARMAYQEDATRRRTIRFLVAFVLFFGVCATVQWRATVALKSSVQAICSGRPEAAAGTSRLERWQLLLDLDQLVGVWMAEKDPARQQRLAEAYQQLRGADIRQRAMEIDD